MKAIPPEGKMIVLHALANKNSITWLIRFLRYENRTSSLNFDFFNIIFSYCLYRVYSNWVTNTTSKYVCPLWVIKLKDFSKFSKIQIYFQIYFSTFWPTLILIVSNPNIFITCYELRIYIITVTLVSFQNCNRSGAKTTQNLENYNLFGFSCSFLGNWCSFHGYELFWCHIYFLCNVHCTNIL